MKKKSVAIIGSGISGLTSAYKLYKTHDITLFEKEDYIGGHTHTVKIEHNGEEARLDTGFIVFNDRTYANFIDLMDELGVGYQKTEMSFSVRNDSINLEYNGNNIISLFAQKQNLLRPKFWKMLYDIMRFNKEVRRQRDNSITIGEYLESQNYSEMFENNYLVPMIAAIWSTGPERCKDFPLSFFVKFFENHGLLDITNRPQWYTIKNGSSSYIEPLTAKFGQRIFLQCAATGIRVTDEGVEVTTEKATQIFDEVVFACHGDQALSLIADATPDEIKVLSAFTTSKNQVVLHTDNNHLPRHKKAWASWNYRVTDDTSTEATLTYNMNILQRLSKKHDYLVTLNEEIDAEHVLARFQYNHPVYTREAIESQDKWHLVSGVRHLHFCGAYWFNGFHEDGVKSGLRVAKALEETV